MILISKRQAVLKDKLLILGYGRRYILMPKSLE